MIAMQKVVSWQRVLFVAIAASACYIQYYVLLGLILSMAGLWGIYLRFMCIIPSKQIRKSGFTDAKQRAMTYPAVYPNGWYHLVNADDVKPGTVVQAEGLGRKFAVWRSASGELSVLDAFCPHGGANLACGTVEEDHLVCPFHLWKFNPDGGVHSVPWLDKPPIHSNAKTWEWTEFHGMVCIWFDAEGREPAYDLPRVTGITDGKFRYCDNWEVDRPIYMHLIEYMENTVDIQHFTPMHGRMALPWTQWRLPGITVLFDSKVVLGADEEAEEYGDKGRPEILYFINTSSLQFYGRDVPRTSASVVVQFMGPASVNRFLFTIPDLGEIIMMQTHLPLNENEGLAQKVRFSWFATSGIPDALASYVVGEWVSNWWDDVGVWEEKIRRAKPKLVKGDGPIQRGRGWYKQFYSESSEKVSSPQSFDW